MVNIVYEIVRSATKYHWNLLAWLDLGNQLVFVVLDSWSSYCLHMCNFDAFPSLLIEQVLTILLFGIMMKAFNCLFKIDIWMLYMCKNSKYRTMKKKNQQQASPPKNTWFTCWCARICPLRRLLLSFLGDSKPVSEILFHKRKAVTQIDFLVPNLVTHPHIGYISRKC